MVVLDMFFESLVDGRLVNSGQAQGVTCRRLVLLAIFVVVLNAEDALSRLREDNISLDPPMSPRGIAFLTPLQIRKARVFLDVLLILTRVDN